MGHMRTVMRLVDCAVCGKAIGPRERRFVEKNRTTQIERHTHMKCSSTAKTTIHDIVIDHSRDGWCA